MNPFMFVMGALNLAAGAWYLHAGNPKLAGVVTCYAVSSTIMGFM